MSSAPSIEVRNIHHLWLQQWTGS